MGANLASVMTPTGAAVTAHAASLSHHGTTIGCFD
jgi:hypothetical protein